MARPERIRLGDLLIQEALLTPAQLDEALVDQKKTGRKLGRIFIDRQWVTEVQIAKAVARQLRAPFIDLTSRNLRPEVAALLPETHARRLRALPIENTPGAPLRVAMADPTDLNAYDEVTRLTRREIDLAVVAESHLLAALDRVYRGGDVMAGLARELTADIANVEDEIGDRWHAARKAEARYRHGHRLGAERGEALANHLLQLVRGEFAGVDHHVRPAPHRLQ